MTTPPEKPAGRKPGNSNEPPGKYGKLTEPERWVWHTNMYAFRRVYLGIPDHVSKWDGDPDGKYFDADMVERETERLQAKIARPVTPKWSERDPRNDPFVQAARRAWCKQSGFASWDTYLDAIYNGSAHIRDFLMWLEAQQAQPRIGTFKRFSPAAE